MIPALVFALMLALSAMGVGADKRDDCNRSGDVDRQVRGNPQQGGWDA